MACTLTCGRGANENNNNLCAVHITVQSARPPSRASTAVLSTTGGTLAGLHQALIS